MPAGVHEGCYRDNVNEPILEKLYEDTEELTPAVRRRTREGKRDVVDGGFVLRVDRSNERGPLPPSLPPRGWCRILANSPPLAACVRCDYCCPSFPFLFRQSCIESCRHEGEELAGLQDGSL